MKYACIAGHEAWFDAGLPFKEKNENPDWDNGVVFGVGNLALGEFLGDIFKKLYLEIHEKLDQGLLNKQ